MGPVHLFAQWDTCSLPLHERDVGIHLVMVTAISVDV